MARLKITNQTSDSAEVWIYNDIGYWGVDANSFRHEMQALAGKHVTLHIHSYGGEVVEGLAIYNAILRHSAGVTVQIDGIAASMASVIALAGSPVKMAENGYLMIHNPANIAMGDAEEMRKSADLLDKMRDTLSGIYVAKTGLPEEEIIEMMDAETWMTAAEAHEKGFIDEITDKIEAAASADPKALARFTNLPAALVDTKSLSNMSTPAKNRKPKGKASEEEEKELTAEEQVEKLESRVAELEEELAKANEEKEKTETAKAEVEEEKTEAEEEKEQAEEETEKAKASLAKAVKARDGLTAKLTKANEVIAKQQEQITDLQAAQADFDDKVTAAAARAISAAGGDPLKFNANPKADTSGLTGRDRARAAIIKQISK